MYVLLAVWLAPFLLSSMLAWRSCVDRITPERPHSAVRLLFLSLDLPLPLRFLRGSEHETMQSFGCGASMSFANQGCALHLIAPAPLLSPFDTTSSSLAQSTCAAPQSPHHGVRN